MIVALENINFGYEANTLFENLNLKIKEKERVGLIGPNGSGKSTVLKLISGLLKAQNGSVIYKQKPLFLWPMQSRAKEIGFLLQIQETLFAFNVEEVVMMGRFPYLGRFTSPTKADFDIVHQAIEQVGIIHLLKRDINELSGGEKQRVFLARALAQQCNLLLLDEPFTYLDLKQQFELCELLKEINEKKGVTLIVVLHDLSLASKLCTELVFLSKGGLCVQGSPELLMNKSNVKELFALPDKYNEFLS